MPARAESNSVAPQVSLTGRVEAIENWAFVDAQASVSQTFQSPFGAQPGSLVNATQNRYTQQAYGFSPYIRGVFGSSNVSYQLRDDNYWAVASSFGNSSPNIPTTYSNNLSGSMSSPVNPWGWTLSYSRTYYDNGVSSDSTTYNNVAASIPYQIDPQLQVSARGGYQFYKFEAPSLQSINYGFGIQWSPTDRTQVGGFLEHQFFGASYSAQISHRLPNAAISASASRGLSSYPQLALTIPAGATVAQILNAAFTTRIPDPAERATAISQFLAQTGLPPTLATPVNYYATTLSLQQSASVSLVLVGVFNSISFSLYHSQNEAITGTGSELPPALEANQNNTQTGGGISYSHRLTSFTNIGASASYSKSTVNSDTGPFAGSRSNNGNVSMNLSTNFGPKTSGSTGIGYSRSTFPGNLNAGSTASYNLFAGISHTF